MAPALIYLLCTATALLSAVLLFRGFRRSGFRLLLWSSLCFSALTLDNLFLFLDRVIFPSLDLLLWRRPIALVGIALLLYGMIWEEKR
jgi:hypothetical protein